MGSSDDAVRGQNLPETVWWHRPAVSSFPLCGLLGLGEYRAVSGFIRAGFPGLARPRR